MDKWLAAIAVIILILCSLLLLDDLKIIDLHLSASKQKSGLVVGRIKHIQNQVKRRSSDDILWSRSRLDEDVYVNDSLLTLTDSQAVLELFENSKIELSENTLIVIEPIPNGKENQIRLRFKRGSIGSKGLGASTEIASGEWELTLDTGSEFNIRSTDKNNVEVEVKTGQATIKKDGTTQTLSNLQSLVLQEDGTSAAIEINPDLQWANGDKHRIYSLDTSFLHKLQWKGPAKFVEISKASGEKLIYELPHDATQQLYNFDIGVHFLRLSDGTRKSALMKLEVSKSPVLHLYYPLPRDRIIVGQEVMYSWKKLSQVDHYQLQIGKDREFRNIVHTYESAQSSVKINVKDLGQFYWRVVGFDKDGYEIPAPYSNEIYYVEDPFEAPGVEPLRKPSNGAWKRLPLPLYVWSLLVDFVSAAEPYDVEFSWKSVKGANHYWLEIDDDPYFQSPEIMQKVPSSSFVWNSAPKKFIYWRVAADSKGRMGLFSPVQKVDLRKLKSNRKPAGDFNVMLRESINAEDGPPVTLVPVPEPPPEEVKSESSAPAPVVSKEVSPLPQQRGYVWYGPGYSNRQMKNETIDSVRVNAFDAMTFGGAFEVDLSNTTFKIKPGFSWNQWQVKDKKTYAFQSNISNWEGAVSLLMNISERKWFAGIKVKKSYGLLRKGLEEFELEDQYLYGPTIENVVHIGTWKVITQASMLVTTGGFGFDADTFARYSTPFLQGAFFGMQINYEYQSSKSQTSTFRIMLPFGYEW